MWRVFAKRFSTFSQAYANAVAQKSILEDACQLNVVQYLNRFQRVMNSYHRPSIPNVVECILFSLYSLKLLKSQVEDKSPVEFMTWRKKQNWISYTLGRMIQKTANSI